MISRNQIYRKSAIDGTWTHTIWAAQCSKNTILLHECVGAEGHSGNHWNYSSDGSYNWSRNYEDPSCPFLSEIAGGSIPPGSDQWVPPPRTYPHVFMRSSTTTPVTDLDLIEQLESEDCDLPTDRPCTEEEIQWLKDADRL